ncbi:glycine betaine/L-proline ABC transporter ATP-binding protein [Tuanshanicoccus lijuaniae]|uniref:quaternary amine ABC transporter ATP-binding protein n=1 Tax=Aerococcaceae bacterium zg-1292 TaxID=2774330 RepID=UPI0019378DBD|nr:glycine betaine/L-proline ABC transporter ATP-binding protein [Aerococcaceae bacterium zg-1292]QQA37750.1 glycine betaine/L-proline ABC transporter ATP-binding protein [Aerococcaceae bacterium zg-1292]
MAKVQIKHLTKIFGKKTKQALELVKQQMSKQEILEKTGATVGVYDISMDINENEIFVVMGLSGSGKSTLIRLLNRLIDPTAGEIYIDGEDINKLDKEALRKVRREKINMVFQNFALFPHRTILENTEYGMEIQGIPPEERTRRAEQALENSGLLAFKDQFPDQLSGGMQQRVGLARALANDPEILLMDEAFSALDPLIRREMQNELVELQEKVQKTIIFITHDLNEALRIGNRIAILKDGQLMQVGTGEEILTNPANDYIRDFVEEVDRSKVFTAENIMEPAITSNINLDGPHVALTRLRQEGSSLVMAVNSKRQLLGYIDADDLLRARKGHLTLKDVINENVTTVTKETLVSELFELTNLSPAPIAVIDENQRLLGVIRRGQIIDSLAKSSPDTESNNELNETSTTTKTTEEVSE